MRRLALLALLAFPAPADAGVIRESRAIAAHVWGNPCRGDVQVRRVTLPRKVLGRAIHAGPSWCRVELARHVRGPLLCTVLLHEYGHLAGAGHSRDRRSVMFPVLQRIDRRCRRVGRPRASISRP